MRDHKTRLTALVLAAALALTACGGMRREDTSYPKPEFSGSPMAERSPV